MTNYAEEVDIENAVERAITECIQEGILKEFLMKNRAEAKKMSIYEYDEEKHMRQTRAEGYEEGYDSGFDEGELSGSLKICKKLSVPKEVAKKEIMDTYSLSEQKAEEMIQKYWLSEDSD